MTHHVIIVFICSPFQLYNSSEKRYISIIVVTCLVRLVRQGEIQVHDVYNTSRCAVTRLVRLVRQADKPAHEVCRYTSTSAVTCLVRLAIQGDRVLYLLHKQSYTPKSAVTCRVRLVNQGHNYCTCSQLIKPRGLQSPFW